MSKCDNPECKNGNIRIYERSGAGSCLVPCPTCSAPPVSSVPGEPKPEADGPYPGVSKTCKHIEHGINAGVCLGCQEIPDYRELVNHGYFLGRASMKAELEAAKKEGEAWKELVVRCQPHLHCVCDDDERCHGCSGYKLIKEVDAALTPKEPRT